MKTLARFFALAYSSLTDVEKAELKAIIIKLLAAVVTATGLLTYFVVVPAVSTTTGQTPPATTSSGIARPFEPGTGFDVGDYCLHRAAHVSIKQVPGAEVLGTVRVATFSDLDYVEWHDYLNQTAAVRHYVDKNGQPATDTVQVVTKQAVDCMRAVR